MWYNKPMSLFHPAREAACNAQQRRRGAQSPQVGKTVAKNRPAPLTTRPAHRAATPKLQHANKLQCYIPTDRAWHLTVRESQFTNHVTSNRHTSRLQSDKNPTKTPLLTTLIVNFSRCQNLTFSPSLRGRPAPSTHPHAPRFQLSTMNSQLPKAAVPNTRS